MADFTPPGRPAIIQSANTNVIQTTFFQDGVISEETAIATGKINFRQFVHGWSEPHHRLSSHIGNERIEDGSTVTDHVVALPARLTMKGHVSDVTSPQGSKGAASAWTELRLAHQNEILLKVVTEWWIYQRMVIRSIDTTQTNRGMEFMMEMQEIVAVGTGRFTPKSRSGTAKDRDPNIDGGQRPIGYVGTDADGNQRFFQFIGPGQGYEQLPGIVSTDVDGNLQLITPDETNNPLINSLPLRDGRR